MRGCTIILSSACVLWIAVRAGGGELDRVLQAENHSLGVDLKPAALVDDLSFLRRASVDIIGRIPTLPEIEEFQSWPAAERRVKLVDRLLAHPRFADRWTVFFSDLLRMRSNSDGGGALIAFVHQQIAAGMPYDELVRRLITTNGKANRNPEVGFLLGDDADPLALARSTSQVFMGVRMGCAECHDHPFDVWTQEDFYGLAAFYGKTRRVNSELTRVVYTTEGDRMLVLWPPENLAGDGPRRPMKPRFPIELAEQNVRSSAIARLRKLRERQQGRVAERNSTDEIDDLLAATDAKVKQRLSNAKVDEVEVEAKSELRNIDIQGDLYRASELRRQLADFVTSPRNRYFAWSFVNRVWAELVGRGFVEPVDDFRQDNPPTHPATLDFLADEFVAGGYQLQSLVRLVVLSDAYQRVHVSGEDGDLQRKMEEAFLATPMRRVLSESLYDSIVAAGRLFDLKHRPGENERIVTETIRVPKQGSADGAKTAVGVARLIAGEGGNAMLAASKPATGYELESSIELDFGAVLKSARQEIELDQMKVMSKEELEAMRMQQQSRTRRAEYVTKEVQRVYDDNPKFSSSLRMPTPAPPGHFLRVFGQPARTDLGEFREHMPTMRQALMMLNGRLTHEASRVGSLEPIRNLLQGPRADLPAAVRLAYLEILTRRPAADELQEGLGIVEAAADPLAGMADLRWVLLNCNEFRYLP